MVSIILNKVSFYYDSPYAKIFEGVFLSIDSQWKTGLIGCKGRGKTTLLNLIHKEITLSGVIIYIRLFLRAITIA